MKNKIPKTIKITKCRLCYHKNFKLIYNFGNFFVSNFVKKKDIFQGVKAPLKLVYCKNCTLLQLSHSAPQELMYKKFYWYRSGVTQTMRDALYNIYKTVNELNFLKKNDVVLDIGANDGTMLSFFKKDYVTIGCEPAKNLQKNLKKNCKYIINDFWNLNSLNNLIYKYNLPRPKLITAIGMFYDLEDPSKFILDAYKALDDNGIFIAQLMCLKSMIKKNDLGNICHEHLEFYNYKSLKYLFEKNGFKIVKLEENEINGGSFRIYCSKVGKKSINFKEKTSLAHIKKFISNVEENKNKFLNFFNTEIKKGKKFFIYGASTKGNTVLQYYKLNSSQIKYASERSPEKWGKYTIGTGIKIISEKQARILKPDYFLVMPYGFINEFRKREYKWLKNGGKFVLVYPKFQLIGL
jgi:NDP-4-keto-2,6-dideoxyhexose 3-C-methyltransferase